VAGSSDHADLLSLFKEFREFAAPKVTSGVPDYSAATMEKQYRGLKTFQRLLVAIDSSGWSVSEQIDYHLVCADMNRLEFRHRVINPWSHDPSFYNTRMSGLRLGIYNAPTGIAKVIIGEELPLPAEEVTSLRMKLKLIQEIYNRLSIIIHRVPASGDRTNVLPPGHPEFSLQRDPN
jgi:hypothetical protein